MADRHHPTHGIMVPSDGPVVVFVTVCTRGRVPWLATDENHQRLRTAWANARTWVVGRYVIMPDHVHLFASPVEPRPLEQWVRYWKGLFTRLHGNPTWRWQTDHWDRRLRRGDSYADKGKYVFENPVRHGLVLRAEDWPHQGEMNALQWP